MRSSAITLILNSEDAKVDVDWTVLNEVSPPLLELRIVGEDFSSFCKPFTWKIIRKLRWD